MWNAHTISGAVTVMSPPTFENVKVVAFSPLTVLPPTFCVQVAVTVTTTGVPSSVTHASSWAVASFASPPRASSVGTAGSVACRWWSCWPSFVSTPRSVIVVVARRIAMSSAFFDSPSSTQTPFCFA